MKEIADFIGLLLVALLFWMAVEAFSDGGCSITIDGQTHTFKVGGEGG